jgi:hypothetical protein
MNELVSSLQFSTMKTTSQEGIPIDQQDNQRLAYKLWEQAGQPSDRALDFWLEAEQQLRALPKVRGLVETKAPENHKSNAVARPNNQRKGKRAGAAR